MNRAALLLVACVLCVPVIGLGALGVRFTSAKLERMEQVRGFVPAKDVRQLPVKEKAVISGTCWLRWSNEAPISRAGPHRFNLPAEAFARYQVGDTIEAVFFPEERAPIPRESVFAEDGNFVFDRTVLAIEWAMVGVPLLVLGAVAAFTLRRRPPAPGSA